MKRDCRLATDDGIAPRHPTSNGVLNCIHAYHSGIPTNKGIRRTYACGGSQKRSDLPYREPTLSLRLPSQSFWIGIEDACTVGGVRQASRIPIQNATSAWYPLN